MIRAKYLGNVENFVAFGIHFPAGEYVEVTDEHAAGKISNNNHFAVLGADVEDVEFTEEPKKRGRKAKAEGAEE